MTVVYVLREAGSSEVRYIGRTEKPLHLRLTKHLQNAKRNYPPLVSAWLREAIDVVIEPIAECAPCISATAEREAVVRLHGEGHRLTNSHLLPRQTGAAA